MDIYLGWGILGGNVLGHYKLTIFMGFISTK